MRLRLRLLVAIPALVATLFVGVRPADAGPFTLITNGGFEGLLANWTVVDQSGGSGSWYSQTGLGSPINLFAVPPPPGGALAAMTDQGGPGSHVMYQDFVVPTDIAVALVQFDYFVNNQAGGIFSNPESLDYTVTPNQQARVDIINPAIDADPFTMAAAAILLNLFQASTNTQGYLTLSTDITALLQAYGGQTLRLRFAEADNQLFFNFGIDNVALSGRTLESVPEPGALLMLGAGLAVLSVRLRRRRA